MNEEADSRNEEAEFWSIVAEFPKLKPGRLILLREFESEEIESDAELTPFERGEIEDSKSEIVVLVRFNWEEREETEVSRVEIIPKAESKFELREFWVFERASFTINPTIKMQKIPQNERNAEKPEAIRFQLENRKSRESESLPSSDFLLIIRKIAKRWLLKLTSKNDKKILKKNEQKIY